MSNQRGVISKGTSVHFQKGPVRMERGQYRKTCKNKKRTLIQALDHNQLSALATLPRHHHIWG
jgi:hypothetical protein